MPGARWQKLIRDFTSEKDRLKVEMEMGEGVSLSFQDLKIRIVR